MHLFQTKPLVSQLAKDEVAPQEQAYYVLVNLVVYTAANYSGLVTAGNPVWTIPSVLEALALIAIAVLGIIRCFDAAGGNSNPRFLVEFTCLSVPVSLTTLLSVWSAYWFVAIVFRNGLFAMAESHSQFVVNLSRLGSDIFGFLAFVAVVSAQGIFFYRTTRLLHAVRVGKRVA